MYCIKKAAFAELLYHKKDCYASSGDNHKKKESGYMPGSALVSLYTRANYWGISMIVIN